MERLLFEDPQSFANTENTMTFPLESPPIIDKRRCISLYCLLINRKRFLYLCVLADTCRFFVLLQSLFDPTSSAVVFFLITFPFILLHVHFIVLYLILLFQIPARHGGLRFNLCNLINGLFSIIYYCIAVLSFSLFLSNTHFVTVCEGSDYGIHRISSVKHNDFAHEILMKLLSYCFNAKTATMVNQRIIALNYYLYLLLPRRPSPNGLYSDPWNEMKSVQYQEYMKKLQVHFEFGIFSFWKSQSFSDFSHFQMNRTRKYSKFE